MVRDIIIHVPHKNDPLAQLAEHLTFNQGVRSSNLRWVTIVLEMRTLLRGSHFLLVFALERHWVTIILETRTLSRAFGFFIFCRYRGRKRKFLFSGKTLNGAFAAHGFFPGYKAFIIK